MKNQNGLQEIPAKAPEGHQMGAWKNRRVSLLQAVKDVDAGDLREVKGHLTVESLVAKIRSKEHNTKGVAIAVSVEASGHIKMSGGLFKENFVSSTGIAQGDYDDGDGDEHMLFAKNHPASVFILRSQNKRLPKVGIAVTPCPVTPSDFKTAFAAVEAVYVGIDPNCKAINHPFHLSNDPDAWGYWMEEGREVVPIPWSRKGGRSASVIKEHIMGMAGAEAGWNNLLFQLACDLLQHNVPEDVASETVLEAWSELNARATDPMSRTDVDNLFRSAVGRKESEALSAPWRTEIEENRERPYYFEMPDEDGDMVPHFNKAGLTEWLDNEGFRKHKVAGKDYEYIQRDDQTGLWRRSSQRYMRGHFTRDIKSLGLWGLAARDIGKNTNVRLMEAVDEVPITLQEDGVSYLHYKNEALLFKNGVMKRVAYTDIDHMVFEEEVIDRASPTSEEIEGHTRSEMYRFIQAVSDEDEERVKRYIEVLGYLTCTDIRADERAMVIYQDKKISEHPSGGTGKSFIHRILRAMIPRGVAVIPAGGFDPEDKFRYSSVNPDTVQVVVLQDIPYNFDLRKIYADITDGFPVRRMRKDLSVMEERFHPRMVATTNYTVDARGDSSERRTIFVEIGGRFTAKYKPSDMFKHLLFDDWGEREYALFDGLMVHALKEWTGTRKFTGGTTTDFAWKQLIPACGTSVALWLKEEEPIRVGTEHLLDGRNGLLARFNEYADEEMSMREFKRRLGGARELYGKCVGAHDSPVFSFKRRNPTKDEVKTIKHLAKVAGDSNPKIPRHVHRIIWG